MLQNKTVTKKPWSSLRISQESTAKGPQVKWKSQYIKNQVVEMKNGQNKAEFNLYQDRFIGFCDLDLPIINLAADEDCQTTQSQLKFGQLLCVSDLRNSLNIPREQTQTNLSSSSFEDL